MPSYQLSSSTANGLFLVSATVPVKKSPAKPVEVPTNHIVVIDCSGSMYGELPKIREQLKKKLPKLIGDKDTLSVIWFSGRGEFGTLLEAEPVATLKDLADVNKAIDRWLRPVGMTGFKDPLVEVSSLIGRIQKKNSGVFSLFFMSDGCDNQSSRADILSTIEKAAGSLAAATFVEYGYYADRPLLTAMAEKAGGQLIFADHFDKYQPAFEAAMGKRPTGAPKIEVKVPGGTIGGFIFTLTDGDITTYAVEQGKANLPGDVTEYWRVSPDPVGQVDPYTVEAIAKGLSKTLGDNGVLSAAYAAISLFSVRMKPDVVFPFLKAIADVNFILQFGSCFGKQKYSDFMDAAKAAAFNNDLRFTKGWDPSKIPDDDAYTVLDLLRLLAQDEKACVLLDSPEFKYSRISRGRVDSSDLLTAEEQAKIADITARMGKTKKAAEQKALQAELAAITAGKQEPLKFEADPAPGGYSVSNLVYNETRPNVSMLVRKTGVVDLSDRLPAEFNKVPAKFTTFIFRNYSPIADGLVGFDSLPVRVSRETANQLALLLPEEAKPARMTLNNDYLEGTINLRALPVINRRMVREASAEVLFRKSFELLQAKAAQKVYKDYRSQVKAGKQSASFKEAYGEAAAEWLKEQGFTDYSGFGPKMVQVESTDFYMGKELDVSFKGLATLPKVADVRAKIGAAKQTPSVQLLMPYVLEVEEWLKNHGGVKDDAFTTWIDAKATAAIKLARELIYEVACQKFAVVVGQVWFKEFASLDENTLTLDFGDFKNILCTVTMSEVQVKI